MVHDASSIHFFISHFTLSFFHSLRRSCLLVAPSSSSLLPPRRSFFLVPPSSLSLFLPRPAMPKSFRIRKRPFFTEFGESVTKRRTDGPTNQRTDKASYRDARTHLKTSIQGSLFSVIIIIRCLYKKWQSDVQNVKGPHPLRPRPCPWHPLQNHR